MLHRPTIRALLSVALLGSCNAHAGPPPVTLGYGYADLSNTTGRITGKTASLSGSVAFSDYGASDDVLIPPGMRYMSYYIYGEGFEAQDFCSTSGPSLLCNFPVVPGTRLVDALRHIPATYRFGSGYWIYSTSLSGVCNGWVLSDTINAATASYAIGTFTCGVRPEDTVCQIAPSSLDIALTVKMGGPGRGVASGTLTCNRVADVRLRTPAIPDSRLRLGSSEGAPIAVLSINDRPAWSGADVHVDGSAGFIVTANVERTDTAGEYSGNTALVIEYL